jgi:hypothetical protein
MRKYRVVLAVTALLLSHQLFAETPMNSTDPDEMSFKQCETIADACLKAGYVRDGGPGKAFWHDCMKPILFKKTVKDVTVNPSDVAACRDFKIKNMKDRIKQLEKA